MTHSLTKLGYQKYLLMLWYVIWTPLIPNVLSLNQSDGRTGQLQTKCCCNVAFMPIVLV